MSHIRNFLCLMFKDLLTPNYFNVHEYIFFCKLTSNVTNVVDLKYVENVCGQQKLHARVTKIIMNYQC